MDYFRRHGNWSRVFMGGVADHAAAHPQNRSVWIIGFEWVWALQARFENSFGGVLANAFIFGVSRIGATLVLVTIDAIFLGLLVASWVYMPQGLFLLIVLGYGSVLMLHVPILERVFAACVALSGTSDASAPSDTSDTTSPQRQ